ncbi:MAG: prepilin-type N-terminal cleavage/methylation domain-containing protein [Planctomycetota bacterium]
MMSNRMPSRRRLKCQHRGLTLFELVVVLAILAATATAAAVATERILLQRRNELTTATLDAVRGSLLGKYGRTEEIPTLATPANDTSIDGFIADLGRLPVAIGNQPSLQLAELWQQPTGISAYGVKTAAGDPEVTLACGWRGPYLDLPIGGNRLLDGFGNEMLILTDDGSGNPVVAAAGDVIMGVTSLGSDGEIGVVHGELPLAEDTTFWLGQSPASYRSTVEVRVWENDGVGGRRVPSQSGDLMVRLYLPDPATGDVGFQQSSLVSTPTSVAFQFPDVSIGRKVLRAYWISSDGSSSVVSNVSPIAIQRGGETTFELILPTLPTP